MGCTEDIYQINKNILNSIEYNLETSERSEIKDKLFIDDVTDIEFIENAEINELLEFLDTSANIKATNKIKATEVILKNVAYIYESLIKGIPKSRIAKAIGVSATSFYKLEKTNKYFSALCERAKNEQVEVVRQSLVSKAQDKYVKGQKVTPTGKVIDYEKYVPADFQAIKFYLLNNDSENYKEKQEIEISKKEFVIDIIDVD